MSEEIFNQIKKILSEYKNKDGKTLNELSKEAYIEFITTGQFKIDIEE